MATSLLGVVPSCMLLPLSILLLKNHGHSETEIGIYVSLMWVSLLCFAPFVPQINRRIGTKNAYIITGIITLLDTAVIAFSENYYLWCVTNFIFGFVAAIRWVTSESIITELAPASQKGKIIGIYGTLICAAITLGPLFLLVTGVSGQTPFIVVAAFFAASFACVFSFNSTELDITHKEIPKKDLRPFIKANSFIFFTALIGGVFENGVSSISPLYAIAVGIAPKFAAIITAVIGFGTFATQYAVGVAADKYTKKNLYAPIAASLLFSALICFFAKEFTFLVYIAAFIWGASGGAIYTVSLIKLGNKYKGSQLIAANSYLIFGFTLGGIIAPIASGIALEIDNLYGLPLLLLAIASLTLYMCLTRGRYCTKNAPSN
jgi:MFS family permease